MPPLERADPALDARPPSPPLPESPLFLVGYPLRRGAPGPRQYHLRGEIRHISTTTRLGPTNPPDQRGLDRAGRNNYGDQWGRDQ